MKNLNFIFFFTFIIAAIILLDAPKEIPPHSLTYGEYDLQTIIAQDKNLIAYILLEGNNVPEGVELIVPDTYTTYTIDTFLWRLKVTQ